MSMTKAHNQQQNEGFAARLRALRKQKNMSQSTLGTIVGVHYTHIGRYEKGQSRPSGDTLLKLADALGVAAAFLIDGSTDEIAQDRLSDNELLRQFQVIEKLPEEKKEHVKYMLSLVIKEYHLEQAMAG